MQKHLHRQAHSRFALGVRLVGCVALLTCASYGCSSNDTVSFGDGSATGSNDGPLRAPDPAARGALSVHVTAQGTPVLNAVVTLEPPVYSLTTDPTGTAQFKALPAQVYVVTAIDPSLGSARAPIEVTGGGIAQLELVLKRQPPIPGAPVVKITSPSNGGPVTKATPLLLVGRVSDEKYQPSALALEWSSSADGLLASPVADATGGTSVSVALRSTGPHVITLKARNPDGLVGTDVITKFVPSQTPDGGSPPDAAAPSTSDANVSGVPPVTNFIAVDTQVEKMVADRKRPYLYAIDSVNNSLLFINTSTKTIEKSIFIGSKPMALDINVAGNELLVANFGATEVAVVNLDTREKQRTLTIDVRGQWSGNPYRIACMAGDTFAFTSMDQWNSLKLVNATTGARLADVGSLFEPELVASPDGTHLYVGESGLSTVTVTRWDVFAGADLKQADTSGDAGSYASRHLSITRDGTYLFFADRKMLAKNLKSTLGTFSEPIVSTNSDGTVAIGAKNMFNGTTFAVIAPLPVVSEVQAVSPDDALVYLYDKKSSRIYMHHLK